MNEFEIEFSNAVSTTCYCSNCIPISAVATSFSRQIFAWDLKTAIADPSNLPSESISTEKFYWYIPNEIICTWNLIVYSNIKL